MTRSEPINAAAPHSEPVIANNTTQQPAPQRPSKTINTVLISLAVILLAAIGAERLHHAADKRWQAFQQSQLALADGSVHSAAEETRIYLETRWHLIKLFIDANQDQLSRLSNRPDDPQLREQNWQKILGYFPEASNFTITGPGGEVQIPSFSGKIGNACRADINEFLSHGQHRQAFIHNNPNPDDYHFDVIGRLPAPAQGSVLVSLGTSILKRFLESAQRPHNRVYLVREQADGNLHIDMSTQGNAGQFQRLAELDPDETAAINARAEVPDSRWQIVNIPERSWIDSQYRDIHQPAQLTIALIALISAVLLATLWWVEIRRRRAEQALIDHRNLLEQRVAQRTQELARANQAKNIFMGNMSHELRTPMNGIIGMTALLDGSPLDPEQAQMLRSVEQSAEHMQTLIDAILSVSQLESGAPELHQQSFQLRDVLRPCGARIAEKLDGEKRPQRCQLAIDEASQGRYYGDADKLRRILDQLGDNALKFSHKGDIWLSIKPLDPAQHPARHQNPDQTDLCWLRFEIQDNGIGIAPQDQERIFDAFTQVDETNTRRYGGAGVGLAIARHLVEAMHGRIGLISTVGKGSTFWFEIPLEKRS